MSRRLAFLLIIITVLLFIPTVRAQDIQQLELDKSISYTFANDNEQFFGQFQASKGDLVSLTAKYDGFVIGTLEPELRDTIGRSIGLKADYSFQHFALAEIPADGTYTVVINSEKAATVNIFLHKTYYLSSTPVEVQFSADDSPLFFGLKVDKAGDYAVSLNRIDGKLSTQFAIQALGQYFNETLLQVGGSVVSEWTATVPLDPKQQYFAAIDNTLLSTTGSTATVQISVTAK